MKREAVFCHRNRPVGSLRFLLSAIVLASSSLVEAGDWLLTESTAFSLTNVDRTGSNPYSGFVLQASPNINFSGESGRSFADVNYRPTVSVGGGTTDPKFLTHDLIARGQVEIVEDIFFLGANAGASLYGNEGTAGSVDAINVNSDGGQSFSLGLTPEFRFHLNSYADLVSLNNFNKVWYTDANATNRSNSLQSVLHIGLRNGRRFGPLNWRADATHDTTEYSSRTDEREEATVGVGYRVSPHLRLNASAGYENNDVQSDRSDTDGAIWSVGADWNPGSRTSVSGSVGERYYGTNYYLDLTHTSRRTQFRLGASREVDNRRSAELVDGLFFIPDQNGNPVRDASGEVILVPGQTVQQIDEDFLTERVRASVLVTGLRTSVRVSASVESRDYEETRTTEDAYYFSFNVNREMGNRISAGISASYQNEKNSGSGDSDYYDVRLSLSRAVGRDSSAAISISHHERDAENSAESYREDRVGITFVTSFL